jgi:hypothetical protein
VKKYEGELEVKEQKEEETNSHNNRKERNNFKQTKNENKSI